MKPAPKSGLLSLILALSVVSGLVYGLPVLLTGGSLLEFIMIVTFDGILLFFITYLAGFAILTNLFSPGSEKWSISRWVGSLILLGGALMVVYSLAGMLVFLLAVGALLIWSFQRTLRRGTLPFWLVPDQDADMVQGILPKAKVPALDLPPISHWVACDSATLSFRYPPGMAPAGSGDGNTADKGTLVFQSPTDVLAVSWVRSGKGFTDWNEFTREFRESISDTAGDPARADEIVGEVEAGLQDRHLTGIIPIEYRKIGEVSPSRTGMVAGWYCNDTSRYFTVRLVAKQSAAYTRYVMSEFLKTLHCHG